MHVGSIIYKIKQAQKHEEQSMSEYSVSITKIIQQFKNDGFTLIEVLVSLVILSIITFIAVPSVIGAIEKAKEGTCKANLVQLEGDYEQYILLENIDHSNFLFATYQDTYYDDICLEGGEISYVKEEVHCSIHSEDVVEEDAEDGSGGSVPIL